MNTLFFNTIFFKYAIEIERTRSITKAAENLYMAQPNLSKAIKEMEETVEFSIFERNYRGVVPTQKGLRFLDYARKILEEMEQINKLADAENPERQDFSISIPRGSYIAEGFTRFAMELDFEKETNINIQETNSVRTINDVIDNKFNVRKSRPGKAGGRRPPPLEKEAGWRLDGKVWTSATAKNAENST
jgi:DNA-binding transcriptional LysR family regulator